jgi:CBS domain-containing protein
VVSDGLFHAFGWFAVVTGLVLVADLRGRSGLIRRALAGAQVIAHDLIVVSPHDDVDTAIELMTTHAARRLPVLDGEELVGVVSLGDLAVERDTGPAPADISTDEPNN